MLDSKTRPAYQLAFQGLYSIATSLGAVKLNLKTVTLDFEKNLSFAFHEIFKLTIVPCLYHFKQALWRWFQNIKMTTKKYLEFTKDLIKNVRGLVFLQKDQVLGDYNILKRKFTKKYQEISTSGSNGKKNNNVVEEYDELQNNESEEEDGEIKMSKIKPKLTALDKFWIYFERQYLPLMKKGILNYNGLDQKYRSNSIIEGYHSLLQQKIPKKPNWPIFVKKLIEEEKSVRQNVNRNENQGVQFIHSKDFNKPFIPENLQKKLLEEHKTEGINSQSQEKLKIIDDYLLETEKELIPLFIDENRAEKEDVLKIKVSKGKIEKVKNKNFNYSDDGSQQEIVQGKRNFNKLLETNQKSKPTTSTKKSQA